MIACGLTQRQPASNLGVSQSVVRRAVTRYRQTGQYGRRPGQGRWSLTTPAQDRYLPILAVRNRFHTAVQLCGAFFNATGVELTDQAIRDRLHSFGLNAR